MLFPPGMFLVDVMQNQIGDDFHSVPMRGFDQGAEFFGRTDVRVELGRGDRPVTVITGVPAMRLGIFLVGLGRIAIQRCDPDGVDVELFEVAILDFLPDPGQVASVKVCRPVHFGIIDRVIVGPVAVCKPIGKSVVHDRVLPAKGNGGANRAARHVAAHAVLVRRDYPDKSGRVLGQRDFDLVSVDLGIDHARSGSFFKYG